MTTGNELNDYQRQTRWLERVLRDSEITPTGKAVAAHLSIRLLPQSGKHPSAAFQNFYATKIASAIGATRQPIPQAINLLEENGHIRTQGAPGKGKPTSIRLKYGLEVLMVSLQPEARSSRIFRNTLATYGISPLQRKENTLSFISKIDPDVALFTERPIQPNAYPRELRDHRDFADTLASLKGYKLQSNSPKPNAYCAISVAVRSELVRDSERWGIANGEGVIEPEIEVGKDVTKYDNWLTLTLGEHRIVCAHFPAEPRNPQSRNHRPGFVNATQLITKRSPELQQPVLIAVDANPPPKKGSKESEEFLVEGYTDSKEDRITFIDGAGNEKALDYMFVRDGLEALWWNYTEVRMGPSAFTDHSALWCSIEL